MKKLLSLVLLGCLLSACQPSPTETITLTKQDAGRTIELKTGETLLVALEGNITTGYSWVPAAQQPELLEQQGEVQVTPASDQLGAPGTLVLQFKAVAQGQTKLRLEYKRPWENLPPEQSFEVTVVIK